MYNQQSSKAYTLFGQTIPRLTNVLGDPSGFWNHLLWAKKTTASAATATETNRNNIIFIKLAPNKKEHGNGLVIEATFDNSFRDTVIGHRDEFGQYSFHFANNFIDRAKFDPEHLALEFESGVIWFPLFHDAICISAPPALPQGKSYVFASQTRAVDDAAAVVAAAKPRNQCGSGSGSGSSGAGSNQYVGAGSETKSVTKPLHRLREIFNEQNKTLSLSFGGVCLVVIIALILAKHRW